MRPLALLFLSLSASCFAAPPISITNNNEPYSFSFKTITTADGMNHHITHIVANNKASSVYLPINRSNFNHNDFKISGFIDQVTLFSNQELREKLNSHVEFYKRNESKGEFIVTYPPTGGANISIKSSRGHEVMADFNQYVSELSNEVLGKSFHITVNPDTNVADVDYEFAITSQAPYFAKFSYKLLEPVINEDHLVQLRYLLSFVQSIPYDTPLDNSFRTPLAVLDDVQGDCDEKSVLLASLLKTIMPQRKPALLVIKTKRGNHAISVVEWPYENANRVLIDGSPYIAMETTDKFPLGVVPNDVVSALKAGHYYMIKL
jgi:hypothetical protein